VARRRSKESRGRKRQAKQKGGKEHSRRRKKRLSPLVVDVDAARERILLQVNYQNYTSSFSKLALPLKPDVEMHKD
jgi:hypothetical protein